MMMWSVKRSLRWNKITTTQVNERKTTNETYLFGWSEETEVQRNEWRKNNKNTKKCPCVMPGEKKNTLAVNSIVVRYAKHSFTVARDLFTDTFYMCGKSGKNLSLFMATIITILCNCLIHFWISKVFICGCFFSGASFAFFLNLSILTLRYSSTLVDTMVIRLPIHTSWIG